MKSILNLFLILIMSPAFSQNAPKEEIIIKSALLAAPEEKRAEATVLGYNKSKELIVLRKGSNEMICIADDPEKEGLAVSCYHKDLEPFMARGRELKKQGNGFQEIFDIREKEVKSGKLKMPKSPSSLFVYTAEKENYNPETGEVKEGYLRSVIYIAYATASSTGLPEQPAAEGMPWIMHPGTHGAHIMINPSK